MKFALKYKIILGILLTVVFSYLYSHHTSYVFSNKVKNVINECELLSLEVQSIPQYLEDEGYNVNIVANECYIDGVKAIDTTVNATKNEEIIIIEYYTEYHENSAIQSSVNYSFEFSNEKITPLLNGVKWNQKIKETKKILGLNFFNTLYNDYLRLLPKTDIFLDDDISLRGNEISGCAYHIYSDNAGKVYKVSVYK